MLQIQVTILKSEFASNMTEQVDNLNYWIKEILDSTFTTLVSPVSCNSVCVHIFILAV